MILLLLACTGTESTDATDKNTDDTGESEDTGTVETEETETAETEETDTGEESDSPKETQEGCATLVDVTASTVPALANALLFDVTLDLPSEVRLACTSPQDALENHIRREDLDRSTARIGLSGLLADRDWVCEVAPVCPDGTLGDAMSVKTSTPPLPRDMPVMTVTHDRAYTPAGAYTVFSQGLFCERDEVDRAIIVDLDGNVRWYWDFPSGTNIAVETQWDNRELVVGGGEGQDLPAKVIDELGNEVYSAPTSALVYHHDVEREPDGTILMLAEDEVTGERVGFTGFQLRRIDPADDSVVWEYSVQEALDRGVIESGGGDAYHANAIARTDEPDGEKVYVSLCFSNSIVKIDVASGQMEWVFDADYDDFTLLNDAGRPSDDYPLCQHGLDAFSDSSGDIITLLMFDNAYGTGASRGLELVLDEARGEATIGWEWSESGMYSPVFGDADYLDGGDILLSTGGGECVDSNAGSTATIREIDRSSGSVGWQLDIGDVDDTLYRGHRVDGCDAFDNARYCDEVSTR